jgi:uncharacterized protein DUF4234
MSKPSSGDAKDVEFRGIPMVIVLSAVTLFIGYPIFLVYQWARELNGLKQEVRHSPQLVLVLSIVTLGIGAIIYECLFAHELERHFRESGRSDAMPNLTIWVAALNGIAVLAGITAVGLPISIACGMGATCLVQGELNKLASRVAPV